MPGLRPTFSLMVCMLLLLAACGQSVAEHLKSETTRASVRVVSTSLCADAYVLNVFEDREIAALSWQADSALSMAPQNLRDIPKARDAAETLIALRPTLVVYGPGEGTKSAPLLKKAGIRYIRLDWAEDAAGIKRNLAKLAPKRPVNSAGSEESRLASPAPRRGEHRPKVLYLIPSGATAGPGTYVDMVIRDAGGQNVIQTPGWQTPDVEVLAALKPDLIITSFFKDGYDSVNTPVLTNRVLQDMLAHTPHVNVPGRLWPCASPWIERARNVVARAIREKT